MGASSYLIDDADDISDEWFDGMHSVGVTAGASAPEVLVQRVIQRLVQLGGQPPEELAGRDENIVFSLPKELRLTDVTSS